MLLSAWTGQFGRRHAGRVSLVNLEVMGIRFPEPPRGLVGTNVNGSRPTAIDCDTQLDMQRSPPGILRGLPQSPDTARLP